VDNKRCLWKVNTTTVKITELPPSLTYEKEDILDKLVENNDIVSYDDNCRIISHIYKVLQSITWKVW
jgi:hypothetical protein